MDQTRKKNLRCAVICSLVFFALFFARASYATSDTDPYVAPQHKNTQTKKLGSKDINKYQTITLQKGDFEYWIPVNERSYNQGGKRIRAKCTADIKYIRTTYSAPKARYVNDEMKKISKIEKCDSTLDLTSLTPMSIVSTPEVISALYERTTIGRGANGNCHSEYIARTYDLNTGQRYKVKDLGLK